MLLRIYINKQIKQTNEYIYSLNILHLDLSSSYFLVLEQQNYYYFTVKK